MSEQFSIVVVPGGGGVSAGAGAGAGAGRGPTQLPGAIAGVTPTPTDSRETTKHTAAVLGLLGAKSSTAWPLQSNFASHCILSFLTGPELGRVAQTCKRLRAASLHPALWRQLQPCGTVDCAGQTIESTAAPQRQQQQQQHLQVPVPPPTCDARQRWIATYCLQRRPEIEGQLHGKAVATVHAFAQRSQQVARTYHSRCVLPCAPIFATLVTAISLLLLLWIDIKLKPILEVAAAMCLIFTVQAVVSIATPVAMTLLGRLKHWDEAVGMSALEVAMHQAVPWRLWTWFHTKPLGTRVAMDAKLPPTCCALRTLVATLCVLFAAAPVMIAGAVWSQWGPSILFIQANAMAVVCLMMLCCFGSEKRLAWLVALTCCGYPTPLWYIGLRAREYGKHGSDPAYASDAAIVGAHILTLVAVPLLVLGCHVRGRARCGIAAAFVMSVVSVVCLILLDMQLLAWPPYTLAASPLLAVEVVLTVAVFKFRHELAPPPQWQPATSRATAAWMDSVEPGLYAALVKRARQRLAERHPCYSWYTEFLRRQHEREAAAAVVTT